jgi:hypothetical protein
MAGRGSPPKPAARRARANKDLVPTTALRLVRATAPELPDLGVDKHGDPVQWHERTVAWWQMWQNSELARDFTASDWWFLLDTALLHHNYWANGHWTLAAEIRLRVAKFGATPEDRARLRITFADADEKDEKRAVRKASSSRVRRGALKAAGGDAVEAV